jgi:septal ring-binding cell division protein DamX
MRFEIRKGGAFLILVALVGLSGAVFALGLVAGYQMARQNQPDVNQTSTTYPLPNAPIEESRQEPGEEMSPEGMSPEIPPPAPAPMKPAAPPSVAAAPSVAARPPVAAVRPVPQASPIARVSPAARPSPATIARLRPPAPAPAPAAPDEEEADDEPAPAMPRHPYNIQIEAVMDKSGADEMVLRLKKLGYSAQEMTTTLNGQTWYRVRVGPYATAAAAAAAQEKLREQYRQAYTTSH